MKSEEKLYVVIFQTLRSVSITFISQNKSNISKIPIKYNCYLQD